MALFGLDLPDGRGQVGGDADEYQAALHPDDRHLAADFHALADRQDSFIAEYRIVRPDGTTLWLSGRGLVMSRRPDGRAERLVSIMADVSERKLAEESAAPRCASGWPWRCRPGRWASSTSTSSTTRSGGRRRPTRCSASRPRPSRRPARRVIEPGPSGRPAGIRPGSHAGARPPAAVRPRVPLPPAGRPHRSGSATAGRPSTTPAAGRCAASASRIDITERKLAEQALQDADRKKDSFIATLAHELRNPLAPIRNAVQLLAQERPRRSAAGLVPRRDRSAGDADGAAARGPARRLAPDPRPVRAAPASGWRCRP